MRLNNPNISAQGGDVSGDTVNDRENGLGNPIKVANSSFDPGYSLESTLSDAGVKVSLADLKVGYCSYGKVIGEPEAF